MKPIKKLNGKQREVLSPANPAEAEEAAGAEPKPVALSVICDRCKQETGPLKQTGRKLKRGFLDIGLSCPHCGLWVHSYYSSPELEKAARILGNFKAHAGRSKEDRRRYEQKLIEVQRKQERVEEQVKKLLHRV